MLSMPPQGKDNWKLPVWNFSDIPTRHPEQGLVICSFGSLCETKLHNLFQVPVRPRHMHTSLLSFHRCSHSELSPLNITKGVYERITNLAW